MSQRADPLMGPLFSAILQQLLGPWSAPSLRVPGTVGETAVAAQNSVSSLKEGELSSLAHQSLSHITGRGTPSSVPNSARWLRRRCLEEGESLFSPRDECCRM